MIKKSLLILVAVIGFGLSANAQNLKLTIPESPSVSISRDGKSVEIVLTVLGTFDEPVFNKSVQIRVCAKKRTPLDALYIDCEYGTLSFINVNGGTTRQARTYVKFKCSVKESSTFQRCGAYDFEITEQ